MGRFLVLCALAIGSSGCGVVLQTAFGWSNAHEAQRKTRQVDVRVSTEPADAEITRRGRDGETVVLGRSPLTDTVPYEVEETSRSKGSLGFLIGGIAEVGVAGGLFLAGRGEQKCFSDGNCFETSEPKGSMIAAAGILAAVGLIEIFVAGSRYSDDGEVEVTPLPSPEYSYIAKRQGFLESARTIKVPAEGGVELKLQSMPPAPPREPIAKDSVIAVMDVQDRDTESTIDPGVVRNLADQLRVFVARRGWRAVDGGSQRRVLEEQIQAAKLDSYKSCFDETCQVELGKALAASHIMRASITRFGGRCVLNGELVDLRTEVIVAAASSSGGCEPEAFLRMSEDVAKSLLP